MNCDLFFELSKKWKEDVCLFGVGKCGAGWGYEIVKAAGFCVTFYVDNYSCAKECNGIPVYSVDYLAEHSNDVLCIVTVIGESGKEIMEQLSAMDMKNTFWLHDGEDIRLEVPQYLDEHGDWKGKSEFAFLMDDKTYLTNRFHERMGYVPDIDNPKTFNEKLQWIKLHDRKPIYTIMADKVAAKQFVSEKIGKEFVVPTLAVYDSFDEIDFSELPNKFVLKCTHDSGSVMICKNKEEFNVDMAHKKLETARKMNYFWPDREWPYYNVPRKIIAEQYIESGSEVLDVYKIFNFDGKPVLIQVIQNDKTSNETIDYYDTSWQLLNLRQNFPNSQKKVSKPMKLNEMLDLARTLSRDIPFVRTDFYITGGKILFSEFTFFSDSGCEPFHPSEWDKKLGDMLILPVCK